MSRRCLQVQSALTTLLGFVLGVLVVSSAWGNGSKLTPPGPSAKISNAPLNISERASSRSDAGELLHSLRTGGYPTQLVGHVGFIRSSKYGPKRNIPEEGMPKHAYSPFDERNEREHPCPTGACDFVADVVLIKLATDSKLLPRQTSDALTTNNALNAALSAQGIDWLEPVFPQAKPPAPGEWIMSLKGERLPKPDLTKWQRAHLSSKADLYEVVGSLKLLPGVEYAEPDYLRRPIGARGGPAPLASRANFIASSAPDDPLYELQWHHEAANVPAAWDWLVTNGYASGGRPDVVVAVIDTGVDYNHPDLAGNMWTNGGEIPDNGVDDDGNGYIDDVHGVNVATRNIAQAGNPMDDHGHGTHVAGIVAAQANNGTGGAGVAYNVRIMAVKAAGSTGVLASSKIAKGLYYAASQGADIVNMSYGGYTRSEVEEEALAVALNQSVLVAAAGNDGKVNLPCAEGRDMYPAAYNWVLGVMASNTEEKRADFSNYDCTPGDTHEYELMAPGVDIWSTIPNEEYAAWDGTSTSAPIVSGIAALLRTRWSDRNLYSSRYLMAQMVAAASAGTDALTALTASPRPELAYLQHWLFDTAPEDDNNGIVNAGETIDLALTVRNSLGKADEVSVKVEALAESGSQPDPYVTMLVDTVSYGTLESFAVADNGLIYDTEGEATGVQKPFRFKVAMDCPNDHRIIFRVSITAKNGLDPGDPQSPYTFTAEFFGIAQRGKQLPKSISEDMTLTKDFLWVIAEDTRIEPGVTVTVEPGAQIQWRSGMLYVWKSAFICNGTLAEPIELLGTPPESKPAIQGLGQVPLRYTRAATGYYYGISSADHCDFESGMTRLMVGTAQYSIFRCGAEIGSFETCLLEGWGADVGRPMETGSFNNTVFLQDNVNHKAIGLAVPNRYHCRDGVRLTRIGQLENTTYVTAWADEVDGGLYFEPEIMTFAGLECAAGYFGGHLADVTSQSENDFITSFLDAQGYGHAMIGLNDLEEQGTFKWPSGEPLTFTNWCPGEPNIGTSGWNYVYMHDCWSVQGDNWYDYDDNVNWFGAPILELPGLWSQTQLDQAIPDVVARLAVHLSSSSKGNAFLSALDDPDVTHWMHLYSKRDADGASTGENTYTSIAGNYWGTTTDSLIEEMIVDNKDTYYLAHVSYKPILETPSESTYPFVVGVTLSTQDNPAATTVEFEPVTFTVTFNRDMDTTVQPSVSFGPAVSGGKGTAHTVLGDWTDSRTWVGTYEVTEGTGEGLQIIRVAGACASDDPWLVTGNDIGRFRFTIAASTIQSMRLRAIPGKGRVTLKWIAEDLELVIGFNLYRSLSSTGKYKRINSSIIPNGQLTYRDTNVQTGREYFYRLKMVKSDLTQSKYSNRVSAIPLDGEPPKIQHNPVTTAVPGQSINLRATVTDNVQVEAVTLFYRAQGAARYSRKIMTKSRDNYTATIEGSKVKPPEIQYYITATDGTNKAKSGGPKRPYRIIVGD